MGKIPLGDTYHGKADVVMSAPESADFKTHIARDGGRYVTKAGIAAPGAHPQTTGLQHSGSKTRQNRRTDRLSEARHAASLSRVQTGRAESPTAEHTFSSRDAGHASVHRVLGRAGHLNKLRKN